MLQFLRFLSDQLRSVVSALLDSCPIVGNGHAGVVHAGIWVLHWKLQLLLQDQVMLTPPAVLLHFELTWGDADALICPFVLPHSLLFPCLNTNQNGKFVCKSVGTPGHITCKKFSTEIRLLMCDYCAVYLLTSKHFLGMKVSIKWGLCGTLDVFRCSEYSEIFWKSLSANTVAPLRPQMQGKALACREETVFKHDPEAQLPGL